MGRFINADALVSTSSSIIGGNAFAYCYNSPNLYIDPNGYEGWVGFGFQIDISTDHGTYGVEIVFYLDPDVVSETTDGTSENVVIAVYTYSGVSVNLLELAIAPQVYEMASSLDFSELNEMTADEILVTLSALLNEYNLSGSVFAIYGYDNFKSAYSYSGGFDTWTVTARKVYSTFSGGLYYSYSNTCFAVGLKASLSTSPKFKCFPFDVQFSHTYYSDPYILAP